MPIKVKHSLPAPVIVTAETGCGCLLVDCPIVPLPPGEWLALNARFVARPEVVRRDVWLKFETSDLKPVVRRVPTVVAMYPHLDVDPKGLVFESSNGEPASTVMKVRMHQKDGEAVIASPRFLGLPDNLRIEEVKHVERRPCEFGVTATDWTIALRCRPPTDVRQETGEFYVGGATDRPPVRIAMSFVRSQAVLVVPAKHFFGSIPREEIATCRSILRRRDGKAFKIVDIRSTNPSFQARVLPESPVAGDDGLFVGIRFRPTRTGSQAATIVLRTDVLDSPEVTLTVEGSCE